MALRIILTTGGTGGHIFPALAVAEALRRKHPDAEILFIGGLYGPEKELVEKAGIAFVGLPVRGFIGRGLKALSALAAMSTGIGQAMNVVREFRPHAVMGFGGYAAFAAVFAAWLLRCPCGLSHPGSGPIFIEERVRHQEHPLRAKILQFPHSPRPGDDFRSANKFVHCIPPPFHGYYFPRS